MSSEVESRIANVVRHARDRAGSGPAWAAFLDANPEAAAVLEHLHRAALHGLDETHATEAFERLMRRYGEYLIRTRAAR